ncbi:MAG: YibE/F family protein [Mycobacteriaceae bacterium]
MGGSHAHHAGHDPAGDVPVSRTARLALLVLLGLTAVLTVWGLVTLWPHGDPHPARNDAAVSAPGVTFPHADVLAARAPCAHADQGASSGSSGCGQVTVKVRTGAQAGRVVTIPVAPEVSRSGLSRGDSIELIRTPAEQGQPATFAFFSVDRSTPIYWLAGLFVLVVALVARLRGVLALVGLGFGAVVLVKFMLPALLAGESGLAVALAGSAAIMYVVLYLAHGLSLRTSAALAGTLVGIGITALIGLTAVHSQHLSGVGDESGSLLTSFAGDVSFQGLLTCALIIAGLGVLNDVTITQASSVWELRAASPEMPQRHLFSSAMRIGRDHIASTIYTIVFAYAGTALTVLLLLFIYDRPLVELLSTEDIAEEVTRTLSSAIGLVLAVPVTTAIAVATVAPRRGRGRRSR